MYSIKQFAEMFNVSEHTVRYYTDIGLLPCRRDSLGRRVFDAESENWMQGICCLKGCGASLDDIKEYCRLCRLPSTSENLQARYAIILRQREQAYKRLDEAKAVVDYMEHKVEHYKQILSGALPDDTNPADWTEGNRPDKHEKK